MKADMYVPGSRPAKNIYAAACWQYEAARKASKRGAVKEAERHYALADRLFIEAYHAKG